MNILFVALFVINAFVCVYYDMIFIDKIVEHWNQASPTSDDTGMSAAMMSATADNDAVHAVSDVDMTEIRSENEQKLVAMSESEILAKQRELLSTLGNYNSNTV